MLGLSCSLKTSASLAATACCPGVRRMSMCAAPPSRVQPQPIRADDVEHHLGGARRDRLARALPVAGFEQPAAGGLGVQAGQDALQPLDLRARAHDLLGQLGVEPLGDRKSTRLNSSHSSISYAVFCLKKKKKYQSFCLITKNKNKKKTTKT